MQRGNPPGKSGKTNTGSKGSNAASQGQHKRTPTILKVEEYTDRNAVTATKVTETALDVSGAPKESKRSTGAVVPAPAISQAAPEAPKAPSQSGSLNVPGTARSELQTGREDSVWGGDALGSPQSTASVSTRSFSFADETPAHSRGPSVLVQPPRKDVPNLGGDKFERAKAIDQKGIHAKKPSIQGTPVFLSPRGTHRDSISMPTTNRPKELPKLMRGKEEYDPKKKQESDTAREDRWRLEIKNFQKSKEYKGDETGRRRDRINIMFLKQYEEYKAYVSFVDAELLNNPEDANLLAEKTVLNEFEAEQDEAVQKSIEGIRKDLLENLVLANLKSYDDFVDFFARAYIKFEERRLELEKATVLRLSEQINYFIDKFDLFIEDQVLENLPLDEQKTESKLPDNLAALANQHIQNLITQAQSNLNLTREEAKLYKQFFDRMHDVLTKEGIEKAAEPKKIWLGAKKLHEEKCPKEATPAQKSAALAEMKRVAEGIDRSSKVVKGTDAEKILSKTAEIYSKFVKQQEKLNAEMVKQEEVKAEAAPTVPAEHKRSAQQQASPQPAPKITRAESEEIKPLNPEKTKLKTRLEKSGHLPKARDAYMSELYKLGSKSGGNIPLPDRLIALGKVKGEFERQKTQFLNRWSSERFNRLIQACDLLKDEIITNFKKPMSEQSIDSNVSLHHFSDQDASQGKSAQRIPRPSRQSVSNQQNFLTPRTGGVLISPTVRTRKLADIPIEKKLKALEHACENVAKVLGQAHKVEIAELNKKIADLQSDITEFRVQAYLANDTQQEIIDQLTLQLKQAQARIDQLTKPVASANAQTENLPSSNLRRPRSAPSSGQRKPIDQENLENLVKGQETKAGVSSGAEISLPNQPDAQAGSDKGSSEEGPAKTSVKRVPGGYVPVSAPAQEFKRTGPINAQGTLAALASPRPPKQRLVPKPQADLQAELDRLHAEEQGLQGKSPQEIEAERLRAQLANAAAQGNGQSMPKQESSAHASEDEDSIVKETESSVKAPKDEPEVPKRKGPGCTIM